MPGSRSLRVAIVVALLALLAVLTVGGAGAAPARAATVRRGDARALDGRAMWIWELDAADGGDLAAIITGAHRYGVSTLIVKSSDGATPWPQFDAALVAELHRAHLRVCAWQYVYGTRPGTEADLGAAAVRDGADCLVVDAESQYDGRYVAAQRYVQDLRRRIGDGFPVALAGLPYVQMQPSFPYSVFLGPGGAQIDMPQMYWRAIGTSVDAVFATTYAFNLPYGRRIDPLGQVYGNPPAAQIRRFRALAHSAGAAGVSSIAAPVGGVPRALAATTTAMASVGDGAHGDLVVWLQEHLVAAGDGVEISGEFGYHTLLAVQAFQAAHGLTADGIVGPQTWAALLRYRPVRVRWVHRGRRVLAADAIRRAASAAAGSATRGRPARLTLPVPASATLPSGTATPAPTGAGGPAG